MRGSMSKKIVITFNIVAERFANIATKARTVHQLPRRTRWDLLVTATSRFDAKVTRNSANRRYSPHMCPRTFRNKERLFVKRDTNRDFSGDEDTRSVETSGPRVIVRLALYFLLSALAAALSAAIGTLPYWAWPAS